MSHLCALVSEKANNLLGCVMRNVVSTSRAPSFLLSTGEMHLGAVLGFPVSKTHRFTEASKQWATKIVKVLEHATYKDRLRKLGQVSLGKRRFREILAVFINT